MNIDIAELDSPVRPLRHAQTATEAEAVLVRDTPYDPSLWLGADNEGVGDQNAP